MNRLKKRENKKDQHKILVLTPNSPSRLVTALSQLISSLLNYRPACSRRWNQCTMIPAPWQGGGDRGQNNQQPV